MKKAILLSMLCAMPVFSMDFATQHTMNAVVVKIASATVDTKNEANVAPTVKDDTKLEQARH